MKHFSNLFNKGPEYYRQNEDDPDTIENGRRSGFFGKKIGEKLHDMRSSQMQKEGIIGPNIQKERMMMEFGKKLTYEEFLSKRLQAELNLKVNVNEELRCLNKWISEYEDMAKFKQKSEQPAIEDPTQIVENKGERLSLTDKLMRLKNDSFLYQPLFEEFKFDRLKQIAKDVFVSPVYNWQLFAILKKRLEIAYEIQ